MKRLLVLLLFIYFTLIMISVREAWLGQPFQLWIGMVMPLVGVVFAVVHAWQSQSWRKALLFLGLTLLVSFCFEALGVSTGWIYGPYHYTDRLGPLILGLVPFTIPLFWYMMAYPSYIMAERSLPVSWGGGRRWLAVAALGGLMMVAWDLVIDPLLSSRQHWVWDVQGVYYGVPLQNFAGWWLTAFTILALYSWLAKRMPEAPNASPSPAFDRLAMVSYALICFGGIMDAWLAGLDVPALIGLLATAIFIVLSWPIRLKPVPGA